MLIPDNPRYTAWLFYAVKYNLNKITLAARGSVIKFITKGNLEYFSFAAPINLDSLNVIDQFNAINDIIAANREENVASRNRNQPVTKNEQGVALVSGCTPRLFSMVASGELSPYAVMMEVVESERYAKISA